MGFLQAVHSLGVMASQRNENSKLASIMNFLQLPLPLGEPEEKRAYAIRVWLDVDQPDSEILDIRGISRIDRIEYEAIGDGGEKIRERCLYREPVGKNVQWQFSPLYKLGKGSKNPIKELLGEGWETDKDCRFYKLNQRVLVDFEESGTFFKDSARRIMSELVNQAEKIGEYWSETKRSCLMVFGVDKEGTFLYPGEVTAFVNYFNNKLNPEPSQKSTAVQKNMTITLTSCALCGDRTSKLETLDKVFKFATFDKPGFLPGTRDGISIREKVFPVCPGCYALLSAGKEEMENRFVNYSAVPGINLYVIPEIVFNSQKYFQKAAKFTKDFLKNGINHEQSLFKSLAEHDEGLVYHFLFAETNQAQLIVHFMIEDVPPSRLKKLQGLWGESCQAFIKEDETPSKEKTNLDTAFKQIVAVLLSLAGKREQDKTVMRGKALDILTALLNCDRVPTSEIKTYMVSRLAGLFSDPDWINPKEKGKMSGRTRMKGMAEVVDFLTRVNGRRE